MSCCLRGNWPASVTMATFAETVEKIHALLRLEVPDLGLQYYGVATYVVDIKNFFIVPSSIYPYISLLEKPGGPKELITESDRVIYLSPSVGHYVRGAVRRINNGSFHIYALDYGMVDMNIESGNIFELLHKNEDTIPGLAQFCELVMCFPRGGQFSQEAIETFKFFMGQDKEKLHVTINEMNTYKLGVEIMSSNSNPDTISTILAYTDHASWYAGPLGARSIPN